MLTSFKIPQQKDITVFREECDFSLARKALKILSVLALSNNDQIFAPQRIKKDALAPLLSCGKNRNINCLIFIPRWQGFLEKYWAPHIHTKSWLKTLGVRSCKNWWLFWIAIGSRIFFLTPNNRRDVAVFQNLFWIWFSATFRNLNSILDEGKLCKVSYSTWEDSVVFMWTERNHWPVLEGSPVYSALACLTMPKFDTCEGETFTQLKLTSISTLLNSGLHLGLLFIWGISTNWELLFGCCCSLLVDRFPIRSCVSRTRCYAYRIIKTFMLGESIAKLFHFDVFANNDLTPGIFRNIRSASV